MERGPVYTPFEEVEETCGRFYVGIRKPPYVKGELGIDIPRLWGICEYANIGVLAILPNKHEELEPHPTSGSINPDGSTTGFRVSHPKPQGHWKIYPRCEFSKVSIKDCVVTLPTKHIGQELSRETKQGKPESLDIHAWQRQFDNAFRTELLDMRMGGLYSSGSLDDAIFMTILGFSVGNIINVLSRRTSLDPVLIPGFLTLVLLSNMKERNMARVANGVKKGSARHKFSFFPDRKMDRRMVYGSKLRRPGLIGVVE